MTKKETLYVLYKKIDNNSYALLHSEYINTTYLLCQCLLIGSIIYKWNFVYFKFSEYWWKLQLFSPQFELKDKKSKRNNRIFNIVIFLCYFFSYFCFSLPSWHTFQPFLVVLFLFALDLHFMCILKERKEPLLSHFLSYNSYLQHSFH